MYVGKSSDLRARVRSYFRGNTRGKKIMVLASKIQNIRVTITSSEVEALLLEQSLIKELQPRYNVILRDGKSYAYIRLTDHEFPALEQYRGARREGGRYFGPYPSTRAVRETLSSIQRLFHVRSCSDSFFRNRSRPCLQHQIGRCSAPCVGMIPVRVYTSEMRLAEMFLEGRSQEMLRKLRSDMEAASTNLDFERAARYRDQIRHVRKIQAAQYVYSGSRNADVFGVASRAGRVAIHGLFIRDGRILGTRNWFSSNELELASAVVLSDFVSQFYFGQTDRTLPQALLTTEHLEDADAIAQALSDKAEHKVEVSSLVRSRNARWLNMAHENAELALTGHVASKEAMFERLVELKEALDLDEVPDRLACFDISHSSGEATVASCVTFGREGPITSDYRKFNINGVAPGDDYAAMEQVLHRYLKRVVAEEYKRPEVLVIDGGRGQLAKAKTVLSELQLTDVALIGIAKGANRRSGLETVYLTGVGALNISPTGGAMHLLQHMRDEAHRFAIDAHRGRRQKRRRRSLLDDVLNVGPKRKRDLLAYFGSVREIKNASAEDLSKVPGISKKLAEDIHASLQPG